MAHAGEMNAPLGSRKRPGLRYLAALALGLAALEAASPARADDAQVESGFTLESSLGGKVGLLNVGVMGPPYNGLDVGLFAGYKVGRFIFGLGLDIFASFGMLGVF